MKKKFISLLTAAAMVFAALPVVAENTACDTEEVTAIKEMVSVDTETEIVDEEESGSETEEVLTVEEETAEELDVEEEVAAETEEPLPIKEEEQPVDVSSVTLEVQSTSGTCGTNVTWTLDDDGVLTISGSGDMKNYSNSTYSPWYSNHSSITEVIIEDGVTSIGNNAFGYCSELTSITIPNSVTSIGDNTFGCCTGLTSITIPDSVTSIGEYAFCRCTSLTSVTIGNSVTSIGSTAFFNCVGLENVYISDIESWPNISFGNTYSNPTYYATNIYVDGEQLRSIVIPDGVTEIQAYAFYNWSSVTSVIIPDSVTSIGSYAFYGCSRLKNLTIGIGVESVGSYAFAGCSNLENVYISDIESWLDIVFERGGSSSSNYNYSSTPMCYATNIYISDVLAEAVTIPDGLESINESAFYGWNYLTSVTIPDSVTNIGSYAFYNCTGLENVYIPDIESWLNISFTDYYSTPMCYASNIYINGVLADDVAIPDTVESINNYTFYSWRCLKNIKIPSSIENVRSYAFYKCTGLTNITIPDSVTAIGDSAFYGCTGLTSIAIPSNVESIGNYVFYGCNSPMGITISDSVTSIGNYAFYGCGGLTSITIPNGVTSIGNYAFSGCTGMTSITIPNSVINIGSYAFPRCTGLSNVTISSSITSISDYTFYNCTGLTSVSMTRSVTDVGENAFSGTNVLAVYFEGDEDDWDYILWGDGNDTIQNATLIYNGDPTIETVIKSGTCGDNISWTLSNFGNLVVSGTGAIPDYTAGSAPWYSYANNIKAIIVEDGITVIGDYAFDYIGTAKNITIPSSVTSIGYRAFYNCSAVNNLYIDDVASWMNIDFEDRTSNPMNYAKNVYVDNVLTTEIEIPNGTEAIKAYAFYGNSSLTSVSIPTSVTSIASSAFTNCSALNGISYEGSESEWQQIGGYNYIPSTVTVYYAESDATPTPTATPTTAPTVITVQTPTVTQTETDDAWSFEVTLETTYADSVVYAAAYDESGALLGVSVTPLNTDSATEITLKKYDTADSVKIFVWNSNMQPISTVWENEIV